ncbi:MAG: hypothetical protein ABI473_07875 [Candidatus Dormibacter sp.]
MTSVVNILEFGVFIAVGVVGIIAFYATLVVVFHGRRRRGDPLPAAALLALVLGTLMVGLWPFYGLYWIVKRFGSAPSPTTS